MFSRPYQSKTLELETAKEILAESFDIRTHEVDEVIQQRIVDFQLMGMEFNLYTAAKRLYLS
jgi:hypothetical protein